jgi:quercetin dioxygenase-like cupin family protein
MKKLVTACCLLALLGGAAQARADTVSAKVLARSHRSWNGAALPGYPSDTAEISVLRIEIAPGAKLPLHSHPVINAGYLISGELTVITEQGATLHLKAGEAVIEVVNTWHLGRNEGDVPAVIVVFYAGTPGTPLSVQKE